MSEQRLLYVANRPFTSRSAGWKKFVAFSKLSHLKEVVSLDALLCRRLVTDLLDEDWNHNATDEEEPFFFWDLPYLEGKLQRNVDFQILGTLKNPDSIPSQVVGFKFMGFDLIERHGTISALSNCGGFDETFSRSELNSVGLIPELSRAREIQKNLAAYNPAEPHAQCDYWAIWRKER